jgi:hypothetical protein
MKFLGKQLEFISLIKRDGSGTIPIGTPWTTESGHPKTDSISYLDEEEFTINSLSMTHRTYVASGFNSWVVRVPELWK